MNTSRLLSLVNQRERKSYTKCKVSESNQINTKEHKSPVVFAWATKSISEFVANIPSGHRERERIFPQVKLNYLSLLKDLVLRKDSLSSFRLLIEFI